MQDLCARLRAKHNDTWPVTIGEGEPVNQDGADAACLIEVLSVEVQVLRRALKRARVWGVSSTAFHAGVSTDLGDWIDAGMDTQTFPQLPDHLGPKSAAYRGGI